MENQSHVDGLLDSVGDTLRLALAVLKVDPEAALADFVDILQVAVGDPSTGASPNLTQLRLLLSHVAAEAVPPPPAQNHPPERERTWQQKQRPAGSRA